MLNKLEKEKETKLECEYRLKVEIQHNFLEGGLSCHPLSCAVEGLAVVMGESGTPTTALTPCLWLSGSGVGAGEEGRA